MRKMDRLLPKGNPPTSSSSEGAFERFLTAAIATIITIIFSWRMLDKINEEREEDEYEPERHKLGHASSLSQTSFVSFSPTPKERASLNYLSREETSHFQSHSAESHSVVSLSERASRGEFNTGGFRFQLETIIRVPVDFPLCGDSPERPTRVPSAKNSEHAEASVNSSDSREVFKLGLTRDTDNQLLDCFIDRTSPGAGQVGDTQQQHDPAITANRSLALLQPTDGLDSRAERQTSSRNNLDTSTTTNRNSISDSSLEYILNDLTDLTDSSIEEAGYTCNENNTDLFLNASNDCGGDDDPNGEEDQDFTTEEEISTPLHTTDDTDVDDPRSDDYFIALSDGRHHNFDQGYDWDDDVQPRELDSDEELFCCSLLDPIIEEDSDDITTSSEGDNSRSDKSSNKFQYDLNFAPPREESQSSETLTSNFESSAQFELDINRDDVATISNEPNTKLADRKCVPEVTNNIPDPDINNARLQNINTVLATDPDYNVSIRSESSSVAHSVQVRAELFTPAVNNRANENSVSEENHSENIRWIGSSVDRFFSNSVIERAREDNSRADVDNRLNQVDVDKIIDSAEDDSVFGKQFVPSSFIHTFSTRVEVEDSNSESDESVQTVISRKTSGDLEGSPQHGSYLTSGLRSAQETNKRPYSDGVLYSSKRWIDEESKDVNHRLRNVSDGGGVAFGEEDNSVRFTVDSLSGRSGFNLQSYKSFTAQDLPTLIDENFDSKLDRASESSITDITGSGLSHGEFFTIDFRHRGPKANKHGINNVVIGPVHEERLFEPGEETDQTDNVVCARETINSDFEEKYKKNVNDKFLVKETLQGEIITGLTDHRLVNSNICQDNKDTDMMDAPDRWTGYNSEGESRGKVNNMMQGDDDEDWEEEVIEETFVLPLPPERSFVNALQSVKSMLDKSESDRSSQVLSRDEDDNDEEEDYQSTCVATMIEVEGHGALGFTGNDDFTSGYRDQCSELERTDRDVKGKMGFKLNLDKYKSDEYVTESGWPIMRYVEKERVYIDDSVPSNKTSEQSENTVEDTSGRYRKENLDNQNKRELEIASVDKEKLVNKKDPPQEDIEEDEVHYVEEHIEIFRMKNYQFGREAFESDRTRPFGWRDDDSERTFYENKSTFYQPSSPGQYTLFGTNTGTKVRNSQPLPEMTPSDNLYATLTEDSGNIPRGDEGIYSPYTSHTYPGSFSQSSSKDVFSQNNPYGFPSFVGNNTQENNSSRHHAEDISRNIFTEDDTQGVSSFTNNTRQGNAPSSNYDEFVRHILSKDIKLQTMEGGHTQVSPSPAASILSGNVTSSETQKSPFAFPENENLPQGNVVIPSTAIFTEKYNTRKEEIKRNDRSSNEEDNTKNEEPEIVKKPKFVRTSTAQDEEELLKLKPYEEKQASGSFKVSNRQSEELERSNSRSSGVNKNTGNAGDHETRTTATPISSVGVKPSVSEYTHFPTNPRLYNFSEPISEPWLDTAPAATSRLGSAYQVKSPTAENVMTNYPFVESPPIRLHSPVWARAVARPNFMEEIPTTTSSVNESSISSNPFRITVGNRNTQIARDVNRSDKPADVRAANVTESPAVKPFAFTQAANSLTSSLITVPTASVKTPTTHEDSEKTISQENAMPKISDLRLPLVSSSAFKFLQERTSQTSMLDRKDRSNLAHFKSEESNLKVETANAKEEKRLDESRNVFYGGGNKDNEPEELNNKDKDKKTATIKHHPTNSETAEKSYFVESIDDILPQDSSSASETASSTTSFDSVEPTLSSTHARLSAPITTTALRPAPSNATSGIADLPKKPKTLKEIKKRYKQPYKSILTQGPAVFPLPKAAPFVVPDHLITPSRMKILQARNQFLSEQNLHTDPFAGEFTAHKESLTPAATASTSQDRKYTPRMYKQSTYRSQEQLEKILYMVSLKPGGSEGSLNVDCLHDDCILSEAGRREILDKTLSIDNLDARLHSRLGNLRSYIRGPMSDSFDPENNSDLFDLTFPFQDEFNRQLDRPASMGELRHASDYTTLSGSGAWALSSPGSRYPDYVSQKQNKKSKSLGTLEAKEDTDDFEASTRADGLHHPPSAHELRISKSLQKLHVPDWYKHVSISNTGNFLPRCRSAISVNSRGTSASLASSPSTTPSISSNVVIKSRVQFPTTARNLRSPHVPSKSAPTTPSLTSWVDTEGKTTPTPVKLPSESIRTADKPTSLMPIPILPLDRIRFIVEKKKELARNEKTEANQTFSSSISHSPTVSQPQTVTPTSPSPTDSFDTNGYNEDENPEEVIPEVIVSPTDPSVRSILKRPISERKEWGAQTPLEPKADYSKVKTVPRRVQEFAPTMTLFKAPVYSSHSYDQIKQHVAPPVYTERTTLVERPAVIDIKEEQGTVNHPQLLYNSGEDEHFISRNEEEEWRPLSITRQSQQRTSLSSSSSSSVEETESKTERLQYNKEQQNVITSLDSPDVFPETQHNLLSPVTSTFPPTIIVTPGTPRPSESHYVNVVVVEPTTPVTILERAPIIRPPDNKPFIAPVIEDHSIIDTPPYFTEYSTQHVPRTWSRSSESFHDSENENSFDRQVRSSKPMETEAGERTWSRSSESFHESDPDNSFNRNDIPHKPVQAQPPPRTWSRSSESFRESDPNNSYDRQDIPLKPVQSQAQPRTSSRSSESFHESDINNSFERQDIPSKPIQTQAKPRTWSRSSESFHESDPNKFFNRNDIPSKQVQTDVGTEKKRTWVPKTKPNRKLRSSREFINDTTDPEYTNTPALQSKPQKYEPVDKFQQLRSPAESESQEESALSEESSSENRFKIKDKQGMYYPHVATPTTRETDPERSSDSYSSRSTHTFQDLAQEDLYEPATVNRKPMIQSNPNFRRSLDRVLDRYTSQEEDQPGDVSERDTESITPTEDPNRTIDSVRESEYPVSNGVTIIHDLRHAENTHDNLNYNWDARSFINGALKGNSHDFTRSVLEYDNQDRDFNNTDNNISDSRRYGTVQFERRKSENEDSQPEYNRRDRVVDRNNTPRQHSQDIASAEDLTYSVDSEQDSIREYPNFSSASGAAVKNWTMPSNWTMPGNSKSHMDLSETYDEPVTQRKPGRTWQPKPKKSRGLKHSVVKHAFSTGDILNKSSVTSLESKVSPEASPYKYKVAGSAFSSTKPDARAGLTTPPLERRESFTSSNETTV